MNLKRSNHKIHKDSYINYLKEHIIHNYSDENYEENCEKKIGQFPFYFSKIKNITKRYLKNMAIKL